MHDEPYVLFKNIKHQQSFTHWLYKNKNNNYSGAAYQDQQITTGQDYLTWTGLSNLFVQI